MLDRSALHHSRPLVPVLLAFCACFVDVVCILGLFHTFTAFITGTLVVLCTEVFHKGDNAALKVFVLAMFFVSTLFWFTAVTRLIRAGRVTVGQLFALEAALVAAFMLVAGLGDPSVSGPLGAVTLVAVGLSTVAMALQNVIMLTLLHRHVPTTMMTGNSLKLVLGIADYFQHPENREDSRSRIVHQALVIAAFAAGGLLASLLMTLFGFWALAVPVAVLLLLAAVQPSSEGELAETGAQARRS
ncbi:YoaK family protein [Roseibium sp. Sym1]|uniref:YoaK family protein n=1 Tax=Roseibium sp. Sym1 TaxID=3016006 RepID=UPI0022B5C783|nr:YoaK family protein [Roseibium sp. Sym1]